MAWIESHQELARHPKTLRLARKLGVSIPAAIGHLHLLWWWAMDFAPDASLSAFDHEEIAEAMLWDGDADTLWNALVESRLIDVDNDSESIHDWSVYAGRLIERRRQDAERKRTSRGRPTDVTRPSGVTVPNRTVPNRTVPPPLTPPATEREGDSALPRADSQSHETERAPDAKGAPNGAGRVKPVLNGRTGWAGCPAGCPTNHGGPKAATFLTQDWLEIPTDERPSWQAFAARHGRPDLAEIPAPESVEQED